MGLIQSMTGFARAEGANSTHKAVVEVKSVNNRFKDFRFRLPGALSSLEVPIRKKVEQLFSRGSFDISVSLKETQGHLKWENVDEEKFVSFVNKVKDLEKSSGHEIHINGVDILRPDFLVGPLSESPALELVLDIVDKALAGLKLSRSTEGLKLKEILEQHLEAFNFQFQQIPSLSEEYRKGVEKRLNQAVEKSLVQGVDQGRMLQEVVFYLEKLDIEEELGRIKTHLEAFGTGESSVYSSGRKLEFLLQELGRETNTIGSKSGNPAISEHVIEMKLQLEKMREQALNLQ